MTRTVLGFLAAFGFASPSPAEAEDGQRSGVRRWLSEDPRGERGDGRFRFRIGVADAVGNAIHLTGSDNDLPTLCDRNLNPHRYFTPRANPGCDVQPSEWNTDFDGASGIGAEMALGVRVVGGLHVEVEAFRTLLNYDQSDSVFDEGSSTADKLNQELVRAEVRLGGFRTINTFANLAYHFPSLGRFDLYAGVGAGAALAQMDYGSNWARNLNPERIATLDDANTVFDAPAGVDREAERESLRRLIAGTTTTADAVLEDNLTGWQAFAGAAIALTAHASFDLRWRYVGYSEFSDGGEWDQLRSHGSNNGLLAGDPGSDPVVFVEGADDLGGYSLGFSFVVRF